MLWQNLTTGTGVVNTQNRVWLRVLGPHLTLFRQMGPLLSPDPTGPLPQSEPPSPCPRIVWRCPVRHAFPRAGPGDPWSPSGAVPVPSLPETAWQKGVPQSDLRLCWRSSHWLQPSRGSSRVIESPKQPPTLPPPPPLPNPPRTVDQKSPQIMT